MQPLNPLDDDALASAADRARRDLPDAPPALLDAVYALWQPPPAAAPTLGRRLVAILGFDSWAVPPALAVRSGSAAVRQLLYSADGRDIDLRIGADGTIAGQVLGPGDGGVAALVLGAAPVASQPLDAFGEFSFAGLAPGDYRLTLQFDDASIELPPLQVGAGDSG